MPSDLPCVTHETGNPNPNAKGGGKGGSAAFGGDFGIYPGDLAGFFLGPAGAGERRGCGYGVIAAAESALLPRR